MSPGSTMKNAACEQAPAEASATAPGPAAEGHVPTSFKLVFERVEQEALALPESELRAVDTDVYVVASGTLMRQPKLLELRSRFEFHQFPLSAFDNLAHYALVASDAYVAHQPVARRETLESSELLEASVPILERCRMEATVLMARGRAKPEEFETISARKSFRNNSEGITRYCRVLERELAYLAECKSTLTEADIAHYMEVARALSAVVGERETAAPVVEKKQVSGDMMTRTFTLFDKAMDSVRAGLTYILRDTPEKVEEYLPRKVKKPSTAKPKKTEPKAEDAKPKAEDAKPKAEDAKPTKATTTATGDVEAPVTRTANGTLQASDARNEVLAAE